ncbi:MAG: ATP-dependent DNA helicase RecQ [Gemmatimonadales bacterium]
MVADPVELLKRHLGYPAFRPGQEDLVRAVLAGRDALGILPTGGGKSVCYQVPALALGGLTLVITPLVSLMEDQVERAGAAGLRAAHLSANQPAAVRRDALSAATEGRIDILFVAPERLELDAFREVLRGLEVRLLAVDEAHCISEWGHDFRPAYRRIGVLRGMLRCPTMALTATATPAVRQDVLDSLALERPFVVVRSFDRPNLSWAVQRGRTLAERVAGAFRILGRRPGPAIVYAPTRGSVERVRDGLAARGVRTEAYHAGLPGPERSRVQAAFMEGRCRVVVATNAFGMGIDKPDVRTVVHVQLPGTLEAYYQEAGRAGRDGGPAACVAFHARSDRRLARSFVDRTHPPARILRDWHRRLGLASGPDGTVGLGPDSTPDVGAALEEWLSDSGTGPVAALERIGAVRRVEPRAPTTDGDFARRLGVRRRADFRGALRLRKSALAKVDSVQRYAGTRGCRRRALLRYFGESAPPRCGSCDRCRAAQD